MNQCLKVLVLREIEQRMSGHNKWSKIKHPAQHIGLVGRNTTCARVAYGLSSVFQYILSLPNKNKANVCSWARSGNVMTERNRTTYVRT